MRILIIHCSYQYKGGEDVLVEQEMALLRSKGMTVEALHFDNGKNVLAKLLQLPFNLGAYRKVRAKVKQYRPDVAHIHNLHFGASPSVLYALHQSGVPFVMTLHNFRLLCPSAMLFHKGQLFLASLGQNFPWQAVKAGVYKNSRLLTLWLSMSMHLHRRIGTWKLCSRYIVLTDHAKNLFYYSKLGFTETQLVVKPNFSSQSKAPVMVRSDYFLFVGRLSEEKGIRLLLNVFSSCTSRLKIAGDGPLKQEVIGYCQQFPNIEFLGPQGKEEISTLMNECNALIFPSIWYEGMPLTIIEALACGAPVIASKAGAMESMIKDYYTGLHFETGNATDLLQKIQAWEAMSSDEKQQFRQQAFNTYKKMYTPDSNATRLLNIYKAVLPKKAARKIIIKPALSFTRN